MNELEVELKARRFVEECGIDAVPVDLARYLSKVHAKCIVLDDLAPGEAGYTLVTHAGPLIHVNDKDREERQRFTICHEVAHLALGLGSEHAYGTAWTYLRRPSNEICCDVFAAELLLPYRLFQARATGRPATFATVENLRIGFQASREATASRLAATSKEICAYILSEGGRVQHLVRSPKLRQAGAWINRGTPLHADSVAFRLRANSIDCDAAEVDGDAWIDGWSDVQLSESSYFSPVFDQTLTLITCGDSDEVDALLACRRDARTDPDSDKLLRELDGVLPWPSGKKRR